MVSDFSNVINLGVEPYVVSGTTTSSAAGFEITCANGSATIGDGYVNGDVLIEGSSIALSEGDNYIYVDVIYEREVDRLSVYTGKLLVDLDAMYGVSVSVSSSKPTPDVDYDVEEPYPVTARCVIAKITKSGSSIAINKWIKGNFNLLVLGPQKLIWLE